jgi:hypothetical protein
MTDEVLEMRHRVSEVTDVYPDLAELRNSQSLVVNQA